MSILSDPDVWSAAAGWATTGIAGAAAVFALRQVREARTLRVEQAQPYVVAYIEQSQVNTVLFDLVVKNFGTTVAMDIRLETEPRLQATKIGGAGVEDVWLFERLPVLVPGQEWRTFWDSGARRFKTELPDQHTATVTYTDSGGRALEPTVTELDWKQFRGGFRVEVYGQHHAAVALRDIASTVADWTEKAGTPGVKVFSRDGAAVDAEKLREFQSWKRAQEYEARRRQP